MTVLNKDKILDAAKDFVAQGKLDKAIREYEKILSADPKDMRVKLRIAELFSKRRQIPEAIKSYKEVAESYTRDGFFLKAVTVFKSILRLNPSLQDVNQALAELYEKMGLSQDASHQYEILANAYEQKGEYEKALKMRERLVQIFPEEATYRVRLAEAYQREDRKEEAIDQFEVLADQAKKVQKDPKRLIDLYEKILPARPDNQEMFVDLINLYYEMKNYKSALKWLDTKKQLVAADAHLLELQAKMYASMNQLDTARGKYQQLAALFVEKGEAQKALDCFEEILFLLPEEGASVKEEVDKIQPGAFEALVKKAGERRAHKEKEETRKAAEEEKKREEKKAEPATKPSSAKPVSPKPAAAPAPKPAVKPLPVEELLKKAKSALSLVNAYQSTGLEDEAKQEKAHAKEFLEKVLSIDPNHSEAKQLLSTIP